MIRYYIVAKLEQSKIIALPNEQRPSSVLNEDWFVIGGPYDNVEDAKDMLMHYRVHIERLIESVLKGDKK